jgi:hypothetical protein
MEKGVHLQGVTGTRYMYHDLSYADEERSVKVVNSLMNDKLNGKIEKNDRCCGESGTRPSPPDISTQVRFRGAGNARWRRQDSQRRFHRRGEDSDLMPILPVGLKRYNDDSSTEADYIVVDSPNMCWARTGCLRRAARQQRRHRTGAVTVRLQGPDEFLLPITRTLIYANVGAYLIQLLSGDEIPIASRCGPGYAAVSIWQLVSYGFLHGGLTHLFFNMFALYMFGSEIERVLVRVAI